MLQLLGRRAIYGAADLGSLTIQLWRTLLAMPGTLPVVGSQRRWRSAVQEMLTIGVRALPVAGVMSFCIGYVAALQSAAELRRYEATRYVVDLVTLGFIRELGALITAIVLSGRSASAIAAEVGTMMITEEVDALRVMGLDPVEFTLAPKYLGALITVPCLTVLTTFCGITAGYVFLAFSIDMTARAYFSEVVNSILVRDILLTLVKSVLFATVIVHVGYMEGLRVSGGPEAVGHGTTVAVVKATFLVILADLLAAVVFYVMGWSAVG
jgi:phospholipid/cholesterol/gamma-HCH transport system permease protein